MGIHLITSLWTELGNELRRYRVQLKLSCRVTVAALFSLAFAQLLQLPLPPLGGVDSRHRHADQRRQVGKGDP